MGTQSSRWIGWMVAATVVLAAFGCAGNNNTVKEWRADAENRYLKLRTAQMLQMAQQQFDTGDLKQAEKTVRDAMAVHKSSPELHVLAGRIQLEHGQLERSFHLFEAAIALDEKNADARYYQGIVLQRWQKHDEALQRYTEAYDLKPDHPPYLLARVEMLVALDRESEAAELLESKLDYFDQSAGVRAALAHVYSLLGEHARAATMFREASLLDPDNLKLREEHALALIAAGRHADAINPLKRLLEDPQLQSSRHVRRALAQAYLALGMKRQAREQYLKLTREDAGHAEDWLKLGELAWSDGDLGGTLAAAHRVIELAPHRPDGYVLAGMTWQKRGRVEEALQNFDRAAQLDPQDPTPWILRGVSLQRAGRLAAAADAYAQALEREPNDPRARKLLTVVRSQ